MSGIRLKPLTTAERRAVRDKSGGRCWYCGCELPDKGWHVDHFWPVLRREWLQRNLIGPLHSHRHELSNCVPSCAPCNLFKATYDIEFFRSEIAAQIERCRRASSGFRIAERMGLIVTYPLPVVFWFEAKGLEAPDKPAPPTTDETAGRGM